MKNDSVDDDALFESNVDQMARVDENLGNESIESSDSEADIVQNDNVLDEHKLSDGDEVGPNYPVFNPALVFDPIFKLGMIFSTKPEFKKTVQSHAIKTKGTLKFTKKDKVGVYVRCAEEDCKWRIKLVKVNDESTFQIREYNPDHSCPRTFNVKNMITNWLCEIYIQRFKSDPKRTVKGFRVDVINKLRCKRTVIGFRVDVINKLRCNVSKAQAYRAKRKALK
ncbi:hypothetical protein Pfo_022646 [Paulownia fortunei]|nr:hypothetical protein Pfo_022646 [Paulownia fortunei]